MPFEPWMLAAMEDEGIMDTRTGRISKVARFLAKQNLDYIGNAEFIQACHACGTDPYSFDQEDIQKIGEKIRTLRYLFPCRKALLPLGDVPSRAAAH